MKLAIPSLKRTKTQSWLLIEYNGFRLTGQLVEANDGEIGLGRTASSVAGSPERAFADVLASLREGETPLPTQALLVTSQASASILRLPINPLIPWKAEQLQELVQWEFEQLLVDHRSALTLETILVGRGLLTEAQVDEVRDRIGEQRATASCITISPRKIGAQVVEMGFATEAQVEECHLMLESYLAPEDSLVCSFSAVESGGGSPDGDGYPWLVCGMGKTAHQRWLAEFAKHEIRLERIYPLGYAGVGALGERTGDRATGLICLLEGADCYTSVRNDKIGSLNWGPAPLSPRNPEALQALIGEESVESLWLSGPARVVQGVSAVLGRNMGIPIHTFAGEEEFPKESLLGAVRHQVGLTSAQTPCLEGAPPPPPWWRQSTKWWNVLAAVVGVAVLATEGSFALQRHSTKMAIGEIQYKLATAQGQVASIKRESSAATQLLDEQKRLSRDLRVATQASELIDRGLHLRQQYVRDLFVQLSETVSPAIAIDGFEEQSNHRIHIQAWALSETEAQKFMHDLTARLAPWGLGIAFQRVEVESGRLGLSGYRLVLELKPTFVVG